MSYLDIIEKEIEINGKLFSCNLITNTEQSKIFTDVIDEFIYLSSKDTKSFLGIDLELILIRKEPKQDITLMQLCFENDKYKKLFMITKNVIENCKSKIIELLIAENITKLVWGGVADIKIIKHYILNNNDDIEIPFMNNLYDIQYLADIIFKINYFNKKCDEENEILFSSTYNGTIYSVYKQPRSLFNCLNYYNIISDDIFNVIEYKEIDFKNLSKIISNNTDAAWERTYIYCMADVLYLTELFTFIIKNIGNDLASRCREIQYLKEKDEIRISTEQDIIEKLKEHKFELLPEPTKTEAWKKKTDVKICLDYINSACDRGEKCKFAHIEPPKGDGDEEKKIDGKSKRKSKRRSTRKSKRRSTRKSKRKSKRRSTRKSKGKITYKK